MDAARLIREARRRSRLTQRELARRVGTSQSAIARYERGTTSPGIGTLKRVVEVCGFDLEAELVPRPASDDSLIDFMLAMSVEDRIRSVRNVARFARELRNA